MKKTKKHFHFHINTPYYGAWVKYGWNKDDWGLGLNKGKIDELAKKDETILVSYGKKQQLYTVKARKVQKYPVEIISWDDTELYLIPKSILNYRPEPKPKTVNELAKMGVFG